MTEEIKNRYLEILKDELIPAMGCTEPISLAYAAALARKILGEMPTKTVLKVSANIIKNVKSVVVPNTGGLRGINAAVAAGIVAGNADAELEVLAGVTDAQKAEIAEYLKEYEISVSPSGGGCVFEIEIEVSSNASSALVHFAGDHTNVVRIVKDGATIFEKPYAADGEHAKPYRDLLSIEKIVEYADEVDIADVEEILSRQIEYNTAIAEEGLRGNWGPRLYPRL